MPESKVSQPDETSRRTFCAHACQAATMVALGTLFPACGGSPTSPSGGGDAAQLPSVTGTASGGRVSVTVGDGSPLNRVGGAAIVRAGSSNYLASRTSDTTFTVLTAICTHEGCTVERFRSDQYVCPCHGSTYTTSGSVVNGPATRSLQQFPSTFSGRVLSFNA